MGEWSMTVDGKSLAAERTFGVTDPATGEVFAQAPSCSRTQLDAAMDAAKKAYGEWKAEEGARRECLRQMASVVKSSTNELGEILSREQGKPLGDARAEVFGASLWLKYYAEVVLPQDVIQDDAQAFVEVVRRPLGVVAAITPWNFPLALAFWKIAPALLAGNTLVLKPSPFTPLATLRVADLLRSTLPRGVLNVVTGGDDLGAWMTNHPITRKVSFTGSIETGKKVALAAASDLKRLTLELGGNDPAIVLDDADPALVAKGIFGGAFCNNGQVCSAIKRAYVPEKIYNTVVEALSAIANAVKVGPGIEPDSQLGPINNRPQFDRVKQLVADAVRNGARTAAGGAPIERPGYFFAPTVLDRVSEGMRIVDEEQFGPALPVMAYRSLEDAIDRANSTHFGLSGSVWGTDEDRAAEVASRLECGTVWVNTHLSLAPHQPFGGFKWSGLGVENGPWGLAGFTDIQVIHRSRTGTGINALTASVLPSSSSESL